MKKEFLQQCIGDCDGGITYFLSTTGKLEPIVIRAIIPVVNPFSHDDNTDFYVAGFPKGYEYKDDELPWFFYIEYIDENNPENVLLTCCSEDDKQLIGALAQLYLHIKEEWDELQLTQ